MVKSKPQVAHKKETNPRAVLKNLDKRENSKGGKPKKANVATKSAKKRKKKNKVLPFLVFIIILLIIFMVIGMFTGESIFGDLLSF